MSFFYKANHYLRPVILTFIILMVPAVFLISAAPPDTGQNQLFLPLVIGPRPFDITPTVSGFNFVTHITHAGDDRIFVVERAGIIRILHPSGATSVFLDIRDRVITEESEQGLFAVAFSPDYLNNGYFYVTYISSLWTQESRWLVLSRFQVSGNPDSANPFSEELVTTISQDTGVHNGGGLEFNPLDGALYLGVGDDTQSYSPQTYSTMKGKIIRFDTVSLSVPSLGALRPRLSDSMTAVPLQIWNLGLRNPWKLTFDPDNGDMFIGDVGGNLWEEINLVPNGSSGQNFGWPCMEGPDILTTDGVCDNPAAFTLPIHAYPHPGGCAIIVGDMYRPPNSPQDKKLIFGDYCKRDIFSLTQVGSNWQAAFVGNLSLTEEFMPALGISRLGKVYAGTELAPGPQFE
jgi:glucose/arabinose dehydrogenase